MTDKRPHFTTEDESMLHRRWVLVAHQAGARIFESQKGSPFKLVERIAHPEGHLKNSDTGTDAPGMARDRGGMHGHSLVSEVDAHEHRAQAFAKKLSEVVYQGKHQNKYYELVLVADPKFMGRLKSSMNDGVLKCVSKTLEKDYAKTPDDEVAEELKRLI